MGHKLLLADDSITMQKVVALSLANQGITVTAVTRGDEAIAKARELQPGLVIADVVMPGKDGYEVCRALKSDAATRHIPVLLLSGNFEPFDEGKAREVGADGHLQKPFESAQLIEKVHALLGSGEQVADMRMPRPPSRPAAPPAAPPSAPPAVARPATPPPPPLSPPPAPATRAAPPPPPVPQPPALGKPPMPPPGAPGRLPPAPPPSVAAPGLRPPPPPFGLPPPAASATPPPPPPGMAPPPPPPAAKPATPGIARAADLPLPPLPGDAPLDRFSDVEEEIPLDEIAPETPEAPAQVEGRVDDGGEAALREALSKASKEVIERIAWEVVPQLAETIIREHVERLAAAKRS